MSDRAEEAAPPDDLSSAVLDELASAPGDGESGIEAVEDAPGLLGIDHVSRQFARIVYGIIDCAFGDFVEYHTFEFLLAECMAAFALALHTSTTTRPTSAGCATFSADSLCQFHCPFTGTAIRLRR